VRVRRALAVRAASRFGGAGEALGGGQAEDVEGEAGEGGAAEVEVEVDLGASGRGLQAQALAGGQARLDAAQEQGAVDAVAGGEALGDGEGEAVDGVGGEVGAAKLFEQGGVVAAGVPAAGEEGAELAGQVGVGVADQAVELAAVLERVEGEVGALGQELADDRAAAAVVDAALAQAEQHPVGALRRQCIEGGAAQLALLAPVLGAELAAVAQQLEHDAALVEVIDAGREGAGVEAAVVAADVVVEEGDRDGLLVAVAVELALAGAGEAGVEEDDQVLVGDPGGGAAAGVRRDRSSGRRRGHGGKECRPGRVSATG
jgi:hypothetical protein